MNVRYANFETDGHERDVSNFFPFFLSFCCLTFGWEDRACEKLGVAKRRPCGECLGTMLSILD